MKFIFFIILLFLNISVGAQKWNMSPAEYQRSIIGPQFDISKELQERYKQNSKSSEIEVLLDIIISKIDQEDFKGAISAYDLLISKGTKNNRSYYLNRGFLKTFLAIKNNSSKTVGCSDFRKALHLGNPEAKKYINDYCLVK